MNEVEDRPLSPSGRGRLTATDIDVYYASVRALDRVSIEVAPDRITGLIGPNGSGKSSLINVISGAQKASSGTIALDGRCLDGLDAYKRARAGIGRTFQANRLFPGLSVVDNAVLGATRLFGSSLTGSVLRTPKARREWREQRDRAEGILATFGDRLLPRLDHPVSSLSYANRRRVEITRALMLQPSVLLLDEPMAGMNPHETWELAEQLPELMRTAGCTVLLIEHKMDVIVELCPWVYVLDHGQCLAQGPPAEIQQQPEVVEAFLGVE